jgi:hypothetical protein
MLFRTTVQPFLIGGDSSARGYELGLGACRCVYDDESVDDDEFIAGRGTGRGALVDEIGGCVAGAGAADWMREFSGDGCRGCGVSESEPLSQASSSAQSTL